MDLNSPVVWLSLFTLIAVLAFLIWNYMSTKRRQETKGRTSGIGGRNDPMA